MKKANCNYPWELWTDGCKWTLRKDDDFKCSIGTFVRHTKGKAKQLQRHVSVRTRPPYVTIHFGGKREDR